MAAGFMAGLCFLAKQDYGVMNLCLGSLVIFLTQGQQGGLYHQIQFHLSYAKDWQKVRSIFTAIFLFLTFFILPIALLINFTDSDQFFYWFNYGQSPHEIRKIHIWDFANHGDLFIAACIAFYFAYRTVRMDVLFAGIFFICSFIVSSTSGLDYTAFFFSLFIPLLIQTVWDKRLVQNRWVSIVLMLAILTSVVFPAKYIYRLVQTTVLAKAEPFSFRHLYVTRPVQNFPGSMPYFKNVMGSDDSLLMINELQKIFKSSRHANKSRNVTKLKVLNISELTPLYAELGSVPPLHYPLWYHKGISLFPQEIQMIDRDLDDAKFDVVILQNAHGQVNFEEFLTRLQSNPNYETLRERGFISPSTSTGDTCREGYCQSHMYVYVRKDLLKQSL
ncbi:hypothetical protein [Polynucleobacter tropicus]|nr:hypothetical protein [Polynucleobacter tropicus]